MVTVGSAGIDGHVVRLMGEMGAKVVVLDIQPLTFEASKSEYDTRLSVSPDALDSIQYTLP